jgi:N6-L-threonylcarbamoyladenine synthase
MKILAIETSCDETAAAITEDRRVLSNIIFSQVNIHKEYGGVYPSLAKREHEKKIGLVIEKAMRDARTDWSGIGAVAVTFGPGLVIALEVGIRKAKELANKYKKPIVPVDHIEGHFYSCFAQNRNGNPGREFKFPFLALVVSGGCTSLILVKGHQSYEILGKTLDDAVGEALDKAARMLEMSYPGGPIIEELAKKGKSDFIELPVPMEKDPSLNFSYSGLKTAFKKRVEKMSAKERIKNLPHLAASFQKAAFAEIVNRLERGILETKVGFLVAGGGVVANQQLRKLIGRVAKKHGVSIYFPPDKRLVGDNAAMIGVAAHFKYKKGIYLEDNFSTLDRVARPDLKMWVKIE